MRKVQIELPHDSYQVLIETGLLSQLGALVKSIVPHHSCALLADSVVYAHYGEKAKESLAAVGYRVTVEAQQSGEQYKTLATVEQFYQALVDPPLERNSPVITLGGGVNGDTAGFVAATYLRGLPLIQCPTTLLAMVDSSVGGKVGVNLAQGKNLVGSFYQPRAVIIDPLVLKSLAPREFQAGLAECVKHGMLCQDGLFDWLESNQEQILSLDFPIIEQLVEKNVRIKGRVVAADEKEQGIRAHLNLGHTFAHAIEKTSGYGTYLHGEAVSLGLVAATELAVATGCCQSDLLNRLKRLLQAFGLPVVAKLPPLESLIAAMKFDKKVIDSKLRLILPQAIGEVVIRDDVQLDSARLAWGKIRDGDL